MKWLLLCPVCTLTGHAECAALIWHTVTMPVCSRHGRSCPFQEGPFPGGCGSESHQTIGGLKWMLPLGSTHTPHTGCCTVHGDLELQSVSHMHLKTTVCSEVSTSSDKCLLCWLTSSRLLFYLWDLGYTGGILDFLLASYVNTLFNRWPQFSSVQFYLGSICNKNQACAFQVLLTWPSPLC